MTTSTILGEIDVILCICLACNNIYFIFSLKLVTCKMGQLSKNSSEIEGLYRMRLVKNHLISFVHEVSLFCGHALLAANEINKTSKTLRASALWKKNLLLLQLNEYETAPYFLQLSQNMTTIVWWFKYFYLFLPVFTCCEHKIVLIIKIEQFLVRKN